MCVREREEREKKIKKYKGRKRIKEGKKISYSLNFINIPYFSYFLTKIPYKKSLPISLFPLKLKILVYFCWHHWLCIRTLSMHAVPSTWMCFTVLTYWFHSPKYCDKYIYANTCNLLTITTFFLSNKQSNLYAQIVSAFRKLVYLRKLRWGEERILAPISFAGAT